MTAFSFNLPIDPLAGFPAGAVPAESAPEVCSPQELQMIRQAQAGSHAAFRRLVESHQALIHRLCAQWLRSGDDASEVCQDTFLRAWQALPAWEPRGKLSAWLCRIALNLCRDRAKSRAGRQRRMTVPLTNLTVVPACPQVAPDAAAVHSGDMEKLQAGLSVLPPAMREVLILCGIEGLSHREAAAILECSPRAVEGRLYRARQLLLEWWNGHSPETGS
ncbi:MAG: RNA polymerase sigma factor [Verrucomicrobiota bacterium]